MLIQEYLRSLLRTDQPSTYRGEILLTGFSFGSNTPKRRATYGRVRYYH